MKAPRLSAVAGTLAAGLLLCAGSLPAQSSLAQSVLAPAYPTKPIRLVVPYPPGGTTDAIGRIMAPKLAHELGQPVTVDNRAGSGGSAGAGFVANGPADGHTLLMGAITHHSIQAALFGKTVPFNIEESFAPVSIVGTVPLVLVVHPDVKAGNLEELISLARTSRGALTYASAGTGSAQHMAAELFQQVARVRMAHVPYQGGGAAMDDLIGGKVQTMIDSAAVAQPHIRDGRLRALATATREPVATLPDVTSAAQAGLPGFEASLSFGIIAPAGTPEAAIAKLNGALKTVMAMPEVQESLLAQGALPGWTSVADAEAAVQDESAKWKKLIKEAQIQIE